MLTENGPLMFPIVLQGEPSSGSMTTLECYTLNTGRVLEYMLAPIAIGPSQRRVGVPDPSLPSVPSRPDALLRALCAVVFAAMVIAVIYAAWIGISNYSRIGV
jgi:hypothetical protein